MQIFYAKKWEIDDIPSGFRMLINLQKFESVKYQFHHIHSVDISEGSTKDGQRRQFKIQYYNSESLPSWFHPQNSQQIHSFNSTDRTFLSLTDIETSHCQNLSSLEQFLQPAFVPIIKKIIFFYCKSLESVPTERFVDLCFLEVLSVSYCPKIKSQRLFVPSLKKLYLANPGNLGYDIDCSSLAIFHLSNYALESIELQMWNLPLLQELEITCCHSLTIIRDSEPMSTDLLHGEARGGMGKFPFLTHLTIKFCRKLKTVDDLLYLPAIEKIFIVGCGLLSMPTNRLGSFPLLKDLEISACPSINWQSGMMLPSSLQKLRLRSCVDLSAWFPSCLENLISLESLEICCCEV
jgi:hypothetical protein